MTLYLVATPIGNLEDISYRAIQTLKDSHYILCEDTRHSQKLLEHYHIQKPLKSYYKFNEAKREEAILSDLKQGLSISLISDAGMPTISDPGSQLVTACHKAQIPVSIIPGPSSVISSIALSGFPSIPHQFVGFLPKKDHLLKSVLYSILTYKGLTVCFESPQRIKKTLELLTQLSMNCEIAIARELTKKFEEFVRGSPQTIYEYFQEKALQGEIVLLIYPDYKQIDTLFELSPVEHVSYVANTYKLPQKDALKLVAQIRELPKRDLYDEMVKEKDLS